MKSFKENIRLKKSLLGTWITIPSPSVAEIICQADFDWISIDLEHTCMGTVEAENLIRTVDLAGKIPLVRLSDNDEVLIKKMMDAGAHGVIVPMVKSVQDVDKTYMAMHYPPEGIRGVGLARAQKYGAHFHGYRQWLQNESVLIVQIENKEALPFLDEIFSSPKVDAFMIGPYDLSASLGIPGQFDHPTMIQAMKTIEEKAKKYNKPMGLHIVEMEEEQLKKKMKEGYTFIAYGVDFRVLESNFSKARKTFNEYLG